MDTSEGLEVRIPALGTPALPAEVQARWEALAAAGNRGWVLRMVGHASSLPGPLGFEAGGHTDRNSYGTSFSLLFKLMVFGIDHYSLLLPPIRACSRTP